MPCMLSLLAMIRINLLPQKKKMQLPKLPIGTILGVLILGGLAYFLWGYMEAKHAEILAQLDTEISNLEKEKKKVMQRKQEELAAIEQSINLVRQQIALIKRLIGAEMITWAEVFEDLTILVPKETVWLKSYVCEGENKIIIQGIARNNPKAKPKTNEAEQILANIAEFIEKLEDSTYYSNIYLSNAVKATMHNQDCVNFSLSCKIDRVKKDRSGGGGAM